MSSTNPRIPNEVTLSSGSRPRCFLIRSGPGEAAYNMAFDAALLDCMPKLNQAVLRFYAWTEPAASFGYFQRYEEVERMTALRPLVRRPTGGGLVPHAADWTYSLCFPASHEWYACSARESYRRVHEWVRAAFVRLEVPTELATGRRIAGPGQCFAGYETSDVLWRGKKIAGAAQRRTRQGLLIQGSVQPPPIALRIADWQQAMCEAAGCEQGVQGVGYPLQAQLSAEAQALANQKFSQPAYTRMR